MSEKYQVFNIDCMQHMKTMDDNSAKARLDGVPFVTEASSIETKQEL